MGRSPRAGPSAACRLCPRPASPGGACSDRWASRPGDTWAGGAAPPCRRSLGEGCSPQILPSSASLRRVAPLFKDASSLCFFPFPQPRHAVKLPLTCISYQTRFTECSGFSAFVFCELTNLLELVCLFVLWVSGCFFFCFLGVFLSVGSMKHSERPTRELGQPRARCWP